MKLLNYTLKYLSGALLLVIGVWAVAFYFQMIDEVYDSLDDGLDNSKMLVIQKFRNDTNLLYKNTFGESNYYIRKIPLQSASGMKDVYKDTLLYMQNEEDYEPVRMLTTAFTLNNNQDFYELKIITSMVEEDDLIEDLFYSLIVLYVVIIFSIIIVNNLVLKKVWKPFHELLNSLKNYRLDKDPLPEMPETNVSEFKELQATVHGMLKQTLQTFNNQKQFTENAAHELQTPLAISISRLELFAEKETITEEELVKIGGVIETLERLTRLNKSLLLLSKIENRQYDEQDEISINETAQRLIEYFNEWAAFKNVRIEYKAKGTISKKMNRELAETLLGNIIRNAVIHNVNSGIVSVIIYDGKISVINTGNNIPLNPEKIFSRFYKESSERQSTGLGLAIVKAIADRYGLKIEYSFSDKHQFNVYF